MSKVVMLESARTRNLRAWLAALSEDNADATSMAVLILREPPDGSDPTCTIQYFNMGQMEFTWAAAKMQDAAASMRETMVCDQKA